MTEEFKKKLTERHSEEVSDSDTYRALAAMAASDGMHHICGILTDIANEEDIHAKLIAHMLEEVHTTTK